MATGCAPLRSRLPHRILPQPSGFNCALTSESRRKPLIAASVIGLVVLVLFTRDKDRTLLGFVGSIATLVVLAAVLVWILGFLQARESRKLHAQTAAFRHPFTLSWSDQGLRFESESGVCALG